MSSEETSVPDRRAYARFSISARVQIEFEERRYFLTETVQLASAGGMLVRSQQAATVGERIAFELRLTSEGPTTSGTGEVVWVQPDGDPETETPPGFGVRFINVEAQGSQLLLDLSEAWNDGGQEAFDKRLNRAVEVWKEGEEALGEGRDLDDTETMLKETQEIGSGLLEDIDTDPLYTPDEDTSRPTQGSEASRERESEDKKSSKREAGKSSDRGLGLDRDVLSKTLDVGGSRSVQSLRAREAARSPVPIWPVLLTAGLLIGGILWLVSPPSDSSASSGTTATESTGEADLVPGGAREGVVGGPSEADTTSSLAFRGISHIKWEPQGDALLVVIEIEGAVEGLRFEQFRPDTGPPREVVRIFGVAEKYLISEAVVGLPLLDRIRVGNHPSEQGSEDRVVLDLPSAKVRLRSIESRASGLYLTLEQSGSSGGVGPEP